MKRQNWSQHYTQVYEKKQGKAMLFLAKLIIILFY
jgi:hypothetical protein